MEEVQPRWHELQWKFRQAKVEVIYTVMQSLTKDGRDRSLDYKISGKCYPFVPFVCSKGGYFTCLHTH